MKFSELIALCVIGVFIVLALGLTGCQASVDKGDKDEKISALSSENAALRVKLSASSSDLEICQKYYKQKNQP